MNKFKDALHVSNVQSIKTTNSLISTAANLLNSEKRFIGSLVFFVVLYAIKNGKNIELKGENWFLKIN